MNAQLDQAVQDAIAQNLPAATASHLSAYLAEAEKAIRELKVKTEAGNALCAQNSALNQEVISLNKRISAWEKREADLIAREKAVLDHEHRLEIAQLKVEHANDKTALATQLFGTVFRNTVVREDIFKSKEAQMMSPVYGGTHGGVTGYAPSGTQMVPDNTHTNRTEE